MAVGGLIRSFSKVIQILKDIGDGRSIRDITLDPDIAFNGKITRINSQFLITPQIFVDENLKYMDKKVFKKIVKTNTKLFTAFIINAYKILITINGYRPETVAALTRRPPNLLSGDTFRRISEITQEDSVSSIMSEDGELKINLEFVPSMEARTARKYNPTIRERLNRNNHDDVLRFNTNVKNMRDDLKTDLDIISYDLQLTLVGANRNSFTLSIPIMIMPNIKYVNAETLVSNMVDSNFGKTFIERLWDLNAGAISLADFIFASDLVRKYKNKKISNENQIANELNKLDKATMIKDVLHNQNYFSRNFNIFIFDEHIRPVIENELRGSLFKEKYKQKMLDDLMSFSASFVDTEKEQVTIFINDIPSFSVLNFNMLDSDKKSDVAELAELFLKNQQPF